MAEKTAVQADGVPRTYGHFSQAVKFGNTIYVAGQLPLDPKTGRPVGGEFDAQARQVFHNLTAIMAACGGNLGNVMKGTLYLVDMRDFPAWDKVAKEFFFFVPPALTTVPVSGLPGGCRVCFDCIAEMKPGEMGAAPKMM